MSATRQYPRYDPGELLTLLAGPFAGRSGRAAMIVYDWQPGVDLIYITLDGGQETVLRIADEVARTATVAIVEGGAQ